MKAGEKNYLKESNGTKANCNANVTQVWKSRIYKLWGAGLIKNKCHLHSHLIEFLTDIKDSHSKSDNLTKSTQEIRHTPVLGGIRSCWAMYQRIRQEEQEDDIECRLKVVESKQC